MIAGDTAAINGSYADGRTAFRWWAQFLINESLADFGDDSDAKSAYSKLMVDYSVAENLARFEALLNAEMDTTYCAKDTLPTPVKDGYLFLGWFIGEEEITAVRSNCTLTAKWQDKATIKYTISYDVAEGILPEDAVKEFGYDAEVVLPVPTKTGYKFLGWYEGETKVEKLENRNYELVAKWEINNSKKINYVLDGGQLPEGAATEFAVGVGLATLPVPTKEGYEFVAWYSDAACTQVVTSISAEATEDVTLYAAWKVFIAGAVYVGAGLDYETLDAAVEGVAAGTTIILAAGNYELNVDITKSITILGPNANKEYSEFTTEAAVIKLGGREDDNPNLKAKNITFNGVTFVGTGASAGQNGRHFLDGGVVESLTFTSCVITSMNTFIRFSGSSEKVNITIEKSHIFNIGQFIIWVTASVDKVLLLNNYIDADTCGVVSNTDAALFRIRYGSLEAYNNYFNGNSANLPGYFELTGTAESYVKFNVFHHVKGFVHAAKNNKAVFDQNVYLDSNGTPSESAPADLNVGGVTVDTTVYTSQVEAYDAYMKYLQETDPDRYFTITYTTLGGEFEGFYPEVYDSKSGVATLPTLVRENYVFLGWLLNGVLVDSIPANTTGDITLVASWKEDALYVGEGYDYATLAEALAAAKAGDKIILTAGTYEEDVTINVPGLTIAGPNQGINANTGERVAEAIIKGVITITSAAKGITFDGLSFTGNAKIQYNESVNFDGFTFQNNKVYDTRACEKVWDETRYTLPGFIQFTMANGGEARNIEIYNNSFVNVSEVNVLANRSYNVTVDGNVFKDFGLDAVRTEGGYVYGVLAFTNNVFEQSNAEQGGLGIFLYSNAGGSGSKTTILIENNEFIKVGRDNGSVFTGAIGGYRFQENYTTFYIANNIFDDCYDYLYLRNNGGDETIWFCTVENNQFLGLPHNQYYGSYRGTDTESSNPHLAVFTQNYYEDNEGNVITDLTQYAQYFKHMDSYGTALAAKPGEVVVEPVEFWTISYDLNGGKSSGTFVYNYTSLNNTIIELPTVDKANHQFNGWLLNGELVTEIPANAKGNLELVADFTVLEGEVYTITFVENKENVIWPFREAKNREEIYAELYKDLYEWAQGNGETRSFEDYKAYIDTTLAAYESIKLRNTKLGNYPAEDGSTEYFLNTPKYFQKWSDFFALFDQAMLDVSGSQSFYTDTYATAVRLYQFLTWNSSGQKYFSNYLIRFCMAAKVPQEIPTEYRGGQVIKLPQVSLENGLEFFGWYDNPEFTGEPIDQIVSTDTGAKTFYGKWAPEVLVDSVDINAIDELLLFKTHQLVWKLNPDNVTDKRVEFFSSDESVATISDKGLITALSLGTTTITMRIYGNREKDLSFDLTVYADDYINGSYYSNSYVEKDDSIQLNAEVVKKDGTKGSVVWNSLTPEIATVDANGVVTALKAGIAKIVATSVDNDTLTLEFAVTVFEGEFDEIAQFIIKNHEDNVFVKLNLGIGSGTPEYYKDIFGSVSKLLMNEALEINDKFLETGNAKYSDPRTMTPEFITVHYTGNMASGADAEANASYFVQPLSSNETSIHYTTGNDGVFHCMDDNRRAAHAGDSGSTAQVGAFEWMPTGVAVGENDPLYPVFTITDDFYYEINGHRTSVKMPNPWNYDSRGTNHVLNADGTISSNTGYKGTKFSNRTPESFINNMGLPFIIKNGEYYMGTTWWCYTQIYEGRICSAGGNSNAIGIESCVNEGSDLWYTWQRTAQLVAKLMDDNNFEITRVRGHHFWSAKDCPQPMLANDCEIWREFLALVEAEYELLTVYNDYEISFESHNPEIIDNHGRVIAQPDETTCVTYTVTIAKDGVSQSITLASMVQGLYVNR